MVAFGFEADDASDRDLKVEALTAEVGRSLSEGRLRIVCGVDEQIESLERLVGYLSRLSALDVRLLQVNRFPLASEGLTVMIPYLHGGKDAPGPKAPGGLRLTESSFLESFADDQQRAAVDSLVATAKQHRATFEYGPSGVSVRARTELYKVPITIAWWYAPNRMGWMRTNDFSFGYAVADYPDVPNGLKQRLEEYFQEVSPLPGHDASSKGVRARRLEVDQRMASRPQLESIVAGVLKDFAEMASHGE